MELNNDRVIAFKIVISEQRLKHTHKLIWANVAHILQVNTFLAATMRDGTFGADLSSTLTVF